LADDFSHIYWVSHKAKALKDNTFLTPTNQIVCVAAYIKMKVNEKSLPNPLIEATALAIDKGKI